MAGVTQFAYLSFSDFIAALKGITDTTRASVFTCLPTNEQRTMALGCWLRKASNDWNDSMEVTRHRDNEIKASNMGDDKGALLREQKLIVILIVVVYYCCFFFCFVSVGRKGGGE